MEDSQELQNTTQMRTPLSESIPLVTDLRSAGATYDQIAKQLGVSRQRAHQIHNTAIKREQIKSAWYYGLSTRNISLIQSMDIHSKSELVKALTSQRIPPGGGLPNFGVKSYHDLCTWAGVKVIVLRK